MNMVLAVLVMISPFAATAALSWAAHRSETLRLRIDQFRVSAPMMGRLFDIDPPDYDGYRARHDLDAIRTRFEKNPSWPTSGATGERR